jgi:hypothetical protein
MKKILLALPVGAITVPQLSMRKPFPIDVEKASSHNKNKKWENDNTAWT